MITMKRILTFVCAALILSGIAVFRTNVGATHNDALTLPPVTGNVATVPLYRFYEPQADFHYYTASASEQSYHKTIPATWSDEGIAAYVFPQQVPGTVPLYRQMKAEFGGSNGFLSIDKNEANNAHQKFGWSIPNIVCYVSQKPVSGSVPLYRLYKPCILPDDGKFRLPCEDATGGDGYFYTTNAAEKDSAVASGYTFQKVEAYVWPQQLSVDAVKGLNGGDEPQPIPIKTTPSAQQQLFTLGCNEEAGKKQITCPTVQGLDVCNSLKNQGQLKAMTCRTTADQSGLAKVENDLTSRGCSRFLGRAGEYLCSTLNGTQACQAYVKKGDGLVTKCHSVKQAEMNKDLKAHGCYNFLGRDDEFACKTTEGFKACENYRIDGQVKKCQPPKTK
jgi:Repeat of unknown function (DUF5648)